MSKAKSGEAGSTVFETDEQRAAARERLREVFVNEAEGDAPAGIVDELVDGVVSSDDYPIDEPEEALYLATGQTIKQ